jgi:hypothetical protein
MTYDARLFARRLRVNEQSAVWDLRGQLVTHAGDVRATAIHYGIHESTLHRLLALPHLAHLKPATRSAPGARNIPCPKCFAAAGTPCRSLTRPQQKLTHLHVERR